MLSLPESSEPLPLLEPPPDEPDPEPEFVPLPDPFVAPDTTVVTGTLLDEVVVMLAPEPESGPDPDPELLPAPE